MPALFRTDLDEILESTEEVWRSLRGARVFLTGATGFFGVWLLSAFAHAQRRLGFPVPLTILTRDPEAARRKHGPLLEALEADVIGGDTRTFEPPSGTFSHFIHGATSASAALNASDPLEMFDVVVSGTRHALEVARAVGCSRFLLMSSGAVYGPQPSSLTHVPETFGGGPPILDPASAYAEGKRAAEHLSVLFARSSGFDVTVARGFAFVGPYLPLDAHFAVGNFLRDAMRGGPIRILGDGAPYRSYMYGTDLAAWMWTLLVRGRPGAAYNVGSDDGRPLREIAARVADATGVEVHVAKEPPPGHVPSRYVPDVSLARTELGLTARVGLDDAIRRTLAFYAAGRS
ncbi:MAG TPA: NAD(P)-dependent oxidoreductase [Labilithrix sp.]|nr:NAD(P)-dependent oxidoreductase [Labilithrix sp.]